MDAHAERNEDSRDLSNQDADQGTSSAGSQTVRMSSEVREATNAYLKDYVAGHRQNYDPTRMVRRRSPTHDTTWMVRRKSPTYEEATNDDIEDINSETDNDTDEDQAENQAAKPKVDANGRPVPRYTCEYPNIDPLLQVAAPSIFVLPNTPADQEDSTIRKKDALTSYTAPDLYQIPQPTTPHVSAGELPVHYDYTRHQCGTIKCDECNAIGRKEVYKCAHCVAQICNLCIESELRSELSSNGDHLFTWRGTELHGGFKSAYQQRKRASQVPNNINNHAAFEGWCPFSLPALGKNYNVYVVIDIATKPVKSKAARKRAAKSDEPPAKRVKTTHGAKGAGVLSLSSSAIAVADRPVDGQGIGEVAIATTAAADTDTSLVVVANDVDNQAPPQPMLQAGETRDAYPSMASAWIQLPGETRFWQVEIVSLVCRRLEDGKEVTLVEVKK